MHITLGGRTALVTGSTSGIGRAVALDLANAGADVVINGRDPDRLESTVGELAAQVTGDGSLRTVCADVGTAEGCQTIVDKVPSVDILINNAGIFEPVGVFDIPDAEWQRMFDVNVMSGVRLSRHYIPRMTERGWGRVIFLSSESAIQIPPEMVHYGMTKAAVLAVARGFAESVPNSGVTVNSVLPGPTQSEGVTEFVRRLLPSEAAVSMQHAGSVFVSRERSTSIIRRLLRLEEVSAAITFLCSEQASGITGSPMRVDGGVLRAMV